MSIIDRFKDYWSTTYEYGDDYKYDLSLAEQAIYGFVGSIGGLVLIVGGIATLPFWCIPYIVYKSITCRNSD